MSLAHSLPILKPFREDDDADLEDLITEDDEPLDSLFAEKQQHLLTDSLYSFHWTDRPFLAMANVGLFSDKHLPPWVPDVLVSLDVQAPTEGLLKKSNHSYYLWKYGKPPDIVVEIVSDKRGGEATTKLREYARLGVCYYVIFDPTHRLGKQVLRLYELYGTAYVERVDKRLTKVGLELTLWQGPYKGATECWLRWRTTAKQLVLTGQESQLLEAQARQEAEQRAQMEVQARLDAEQARLEAEQHATAETYARQEAEQRAQAESHARQNAEQAHLVAEQRAQAEAQGRQLEAQARREAEQQFQMESHARQDAEQAHIEAEQRAQAEAQGRQNAEQAHLVAEQRAHAEAHARQNAEQAHLVAEQRAQAEAQGRQLEAQARREAEQQFQMESHARLEAEQAHLVAEQRAKAESHARLEAERRAEAEAEARLAAEAELARLRALLGRQEAPG